MAKDIDIVKVLHPKSDELHEDEMGNITAQIVDEELDAFECRFNYDGCVEIDTNGCKWITLSKNNLLKLVKLIDDAEKRYDEMEDEI